MTFELSLSYLKDNIDNRGYHNQWIQNSAEISTWPYIEITT